MKPDLQAKLSLLDYTVDWLQSGILTEEALDYQLRELAIGEDAEKEHYRYRMFITYLNSKAVLSDVEIERIIKLFQFEADKNMAGSALAKLLEKPSLTDTQFAIVSEALSEFGNWTEKKIKKQLKIRTKV
jgi:hypothetical protein